MERKKLTVLLVSVLLLAAAGAYVMFYFGIALNFNPTGRPTPPELEHTNLTVSGTYNETAETLQLRVESGRATAAHYDYIEVAPHIDRGNESVLRAPNGSRYTRYWVDTKHRSVTTFPLEAGATVTVITGDTTDDDGDGIAGFDGNDRIDLQYGTRVGTGVGRTLAYWTLENGTLAKHNG